MAQVSAFRHSLLLKVAGKSCRRQHSSARGRPIDVVVPPAGSACRGGNRRSIRDLEVQPRILNSSSKLVVETPYRGEPILPKKAAAADNWTEAEAIEQAKQGCAEAFEHLYHLHKRRVYSLCLRMTGNTAEAEDLAQEAFLQLFRKISTFRGESAFSTWLHRLSVNVVLMHLRRKGLPEVSLEETTEPTQEDGPKRDIGARDQVLVGSIDRVNLERAIEQLPPGYRTIFVLHDMEGYEHNEIAEMMQCSIGNSKSQLHKARMKLRDLLQIPNQGAARSAS